MRNAFYARQVLNDDRATAEQKARAREKLGERGALAEVTEKKIAAAREAGRKIRETRERQAAGVPAVPTLEPASRDPFNPVLFTKIMEAQAGVTGAAKEDAIRARAIIDDKSKSAAQKADARKILAGYEKSKEEWLQHCRTQNDLLLGELAERARIDRMCRGPEPSRRGGWVGHPGGGPGCGGGGGGGCGGGGGG